MLTPATGTDAPLLSVPDPTEGAGAAVVANVEHTQYVCVDAVEQALARLMFEMKLPELERFAGELLGLPPKARYPPKGRGHTPTSQSNFYHILVNRACARTGCG